MIEIRRKNGVGMSPPGMDGDVRAVKIISCILRIDRLDDVLKAICGRYPVSGVT